MTFSSTLTRRWMLRSFTPASDIPAGWTTEPTFVWRCTVCALLAILFTLLVVRHSEVYGRLRVVPAYDDVVYLIDGQRRLENLYQKGMRGFIKNLVFDVPHSPFSTLLATVGFALIGPEPESAYLLNGIIVLILLLHVDVLLGHAGWWPRFAAYGFALSLPAAGSAVNEFRPDLACGLVTAAGLLFTIRTRWLEADLHHKAIPGIYWGLAMLVKPSVFVLTSLFFTVAIVGAIVPDYIRLRRRLVVADDSNDRGGFIRALLTTVARASAPAFLVAASLSGPLFLLQGRTLWNYFYDSIFGSYKYLWEYRASWLKHLQYFLVGSGGEITLGSHLFLVPILVACMVLLLLIKRRRKELGFLVGLIALTFLTWLVPTLNSVKNPYFGATFGFLMLFLGVLSLRHLLTGPTASWKTRILAAACVFFALYSWRLPTGSYQLRDPLPDNINRVVRSVTTAVEQAAYGGRRIVYLPATGYLNIDVLQFYIFRDGFRTQNFDFINKPFSDDEDLHNKYFDTTDIVVVGECDNGLTNEGFPSGPIQDRLIHLLRERTDFEQTEAIPAMNGKSFFVFCKKRT